MQPCPIIRMLTCRDRPYGSVRNVVHKIRAALANEDRDVVLCARTLRSHVEPIRKRNALRKQKLRIRLAGRTPLKHTSPALEFLRRLEEISLSAKAQAQEKRKAQEEASKAYSNRPAQMYLIKRRSLYQPGDDRSGGRTSRS